MANIVYRGAATPTVVNAAANKNAALTNDEIDKNFFALNVGPTIGSTTISPGTSSTTLAGLTSVTSTAFVGTLSTAAQPSITSVGTLTSLTTSGNVTVGGNLTINGTTTTINTATLEVVDLNITVAKNAASGGAANGAGLTVNGANATFTYSSGDDRWNLNKNLNVSNVYAARFMADAGSAAAPSMAFNSDGATDTGFYWGGDGYTHIANNGVYSGKFGPGGALTMAGIITGSNLSGTNTGDNPGVTSVGAVTPIVSSGGTTPSISHAASGVSAGTYNNVAVNTTGHVIGGSNVAYLTAEADTLATVTGRGNTTGSAIVVSSNLSMSMFTGTKSGASYSDTLGVFRAVVDNTNGTSNTFFEGYVGGTRSFYVRADGYIYSGVTAGLSISGTAAKASTLAQGGANGTAMTFNWSGQSGQPTWLWGGDDGTTTNVYNPSNFSVNYAITAGSASASDVYAWAKASTKPSYTAAEVGLGNVSNTNWVSITARSALDYNLAGRTNGSYACENTGTNGPGAAYLNLIHQVGSGDVGFQIAGGYTSDAMYFRGSSGVQLGSGYTPWRTVLHNGNYNSYALPLGGGNMTGRISGATGNGASGGFGFDSDTAMTSSGDGNLKFYSNGVYCGGPAVGSNSWDINITGSAGSAPASDVYAWAKVASKPVYYQNEIGSGALVATTATFTGDITVGYNQASSSIYMSDVDEGTRQIHCNSSRIGFLTQAGSWGSYCDDDGSWTSVQNITAYSDIKLKENIVTIDSALDKTLKLRGVYYTRKDNNNVRKVGVIAQEIQEILPEVVRSNYDKTDDSTTLSVDYGNITALLIEAIKELNAKVTDLQNQLANK